MTPHRPTSLTRGQVLAASAAALGVLAAVAGGPSRPAIDAAALAAEIEREADHVTALELAEWVRDRKPGLRVLDLRDDSAYAAYHVPGAERVPLSSVPALRPRAGETLVLYSEGGAHAAQAWVLLRAAGHERVYFLRGGLLDWLEDVMSPALRADTASLSPAARAADARVAALSRYFGGVPRVAAEGVAATADGEAHRHRAGSAASVVARTRRRGC